MTAPKLPQQGSHAANPQRRAASASPLLQGLAAKIQAETAAEQALPKVEAQAAGRSTLHKLILGGVLLAMAIPMIISQFSH